MTTGNPPLLPSPKTQKWMRSSLPSASPVVWWSCWFNGGRATDRVAIKFSPPRMCHIVAAPLLIQDIHSWTRQGIGVAKCGVVRPAGTGWGNRSSSPRRLGGRRHLFERVQRLIGRLKRWIALQQTPPKSGELRLCCTAFRLVTALQEQLPC